MRYRDELKEKGVLLFSIKENVDPTTKTGKLFMDFMSLIAEWEREVIQEQMYENKMHKWKEKRTFIGKPPFGYIWDGENLEINPKVAIYRRDAVKALQIIHKKEKKYDLVFIGAPYPYPHTALILSLADEYDILNERGWLLLEHHRRSSFTAGGPHLNFRKKYVYGQTVIALFERPDD